MNNEHIFTVCRDDRGHHSYRGELCQETCLKEDKDISGEYVWKIYVDSLIIYHCERCPIIYQNEEVIYYKRPGSHFLDMVLRHCILEYHDKVCRGVYLTEPPEHIKVQLGLILNKR